MKFFPFGRKPLLIETVNNHRSDYAPLESKEFVTHKGVDEIGSYIVTMRTPAKPETENSPSDVGVISTSLTECRFYKVVGNGGPAKHYIDGSLDFFFPGGRVKITVDAEGKK